MYKFIKTRDPRNQFDQSDILLKTDAAMLSDILDDIKGFLQACGFIIDGDLEVVKDEPANTTGFNVGDVVFCKEGKQIAANLYLDVAYRIDFIDPVLKIAKLSEKQGYFLLEWLQDEWEYKDSKLKSETESGSEK